MSLILWLRYLPKNIAGITEGKEIKKYSKIFNVKRFFAKYPKAAIKLACKKYACRAVGKISIQNEQGKMITHHYCDIWRFKALLLSPCIMHKSIFYFRRLKYFLYFCCGTKGKLMNRALNA